MHLWLYLLTHVTILLFQFERNNALAEQYRALAAEDEKVIFGGRLGEYRYYDMDKVIESALKLEIR